MRANLYYSNLSKKAVKTESADEERKKLEEAIKKYLAGGGKITVIPAGVTRLSLNDETERDN